MVRRILNEIPGTSMTRYLSESGDRPLHTRYVEQQEVLITPIYTWLGGQTCEYMWKNAIQLPIQTEKNKNLPVSGALLCMKYQQDTSISLDMFAESSLKMSKCLETTP